MPYLFLAIAILSEVCATTALQAADAFTKPVPSLIVIVGYASAFYFLARCLEVINVGVAYAIWSGIGVVLITVFAAVLYKQAIDLPGLLGMGLIISGVAVLNLWSETVAH